MVHRRAKVAVELVQGFGSTLLTGSNSEERELRDYVKALRRRLPWVLASLLLFSLLAVLWTNTRSLVYEATARVLLGESPALDAVAGRSSTNLGTRVRDLENEINLAESDAALALVRAELGLDADEELPEGEILAAPESDILHFTFTGPTAEDAALAANVWAQTYVTLKQSEATASIDEVVVQLQERLTTFRARRAEIRTELERLENELVRATDDGDRAALQLQINRETSAISGDLGLVDAQIAANIQSITQLELSGELASAGAIRIVGAAVPPREPTNAPLSRNLVLAAILGGLVGVSAAFLIDNLDRSIADGEDLQRLGITFLGTIPRAPRRMVRAGLTKVAVTAPGSPVADAYQKVRTALQFVMLDDDVKTILVTSPQQGDGKTTTAVNLSLAFANVESRVVLADVDFRRSQIHKEFGTSLVPGISDSLVDSLPLPKIAVSLPELSTTLLAMPAGTQPPNPAAFLSTSLVSRLLAELRTQADLTILDSPPVLPVADALSIVSHVDGVVLVVVAGSTTMDDLASTVDSINRSGGKLLGVVINKSGGAKRLSNSQTSAKMEQVADYPPIPVQRRADVLSG